MYGGCVNTQYLNLHCHNAVFPSKSDLVCGYKVVTRQPQQQGIQYH